jgi:uncharacterized protein YprB with RNaseH-like and TPR domain
VIECSFRIAPGVGAELETRLWRAGVLRWADYPAGRPGPVPAPVDARLRAALVRAREALAARDAEALAQLLPRSERWRLYATFRDETAFVDVESDGDALTAIGVLDAAGPRIFLAGRNLPEFPEATRGWKLLATYNGLAFDVPALRRAFPSWRPPRAHVDLRHLWSRLGHQGGLKQLEQETGVGRPAELARLSGGDAVRLWRAHLAGDGEALRLFAGYNLHDAVNLRTLLDLGYNRMIDRLRLPAPPVPVSERGDVRYDMTRVVLAL